jgi:nucleotide-binding universal stress UspA family protein
MFRRIIVALDDGPHSYDALALAQRLRDPQHGALILACVVSRHVWHPRSSGHAPERMHEEAALVFAGARARIPPSTPVRLRSLVAGSAAQGLTEVADAERADVIVVGSSRRGPAGHVSLGRTGLGLLHRAPCAIAVAPVDARAYAPFRLIGVAYDGSPDADGALAAGYAIAAASGAAVTLYSALDVAVGGSAPVDDGLDRLQRRMRLEAQAKLDAAADAAPGGVNPRTVLLHGSPGPVIADACDGIVDLLVTGSHGYGHLQRAVIGSVSVALIDNARHPVLVVPRSPLPAAAGQWPVTSTQPVRRRFISRRPPRAQADARDAGPLARCFQAALPPSLSGRACR